MTKPRELGDKAKKVIELILEDAIANNGAIYEALEALALDKNADAVLALRKQKELNQRIEMVCWALLRGDVDEAMKRANTDRPPKND